MKTASSTSAGARLLPDRKGHCWYALVHEIWHASMFHEHCFRCEASSSTHRASQREDLLVKSGLVLFSPPFKGWRALLASSLVGMPYVALGGIWSRIQPPLHHRSSPSSQSWTSMSMPITMGGSSSCRSVFCAPPGLSAPLPPAPRMGSNQQELSPLVELDA